MLQDIKLPAPQVNTPDPSGSPMAGESLEKVCADIKRLIDKYTASGDMDTAKQLQEMYDTCEELITTAKNNSSNTGDEKEGDATEESEQGATDKPLDTSLLLGDMGKLKGYLAQKSVDSSPKPYVG